MLFFGGIILDKCGIRFTGTMSCSFMVIGVLLKWYALSHDFGEGTFMGYHLQAVYAALGFAIFGMGAEITGITVSKVIIKWFTGHEVALAMGLQVATARIGTAVALACSLPMARAAGSVSFPVLVGGTCICIGLIAYLVYCVMDKKLDQSAETVAEEKEEGFQLKDLKLIFTSKGFWLITILCLMFYAGVFPFLKFATKLMIAKYHVEPEIAGLIPAMLPFGTILLTPVFGSLYDRIGKGATLMVIGSVMLTVVHVLFAPAAAQRVVVCRHHHGHPRHRLLARAVGHVALRAQNHPDEAAGFGLRHHLLHPEHRPLHGAAAHRLGHRPLLHHPHARRHRQLRLHAAHVHLCPLRFRGHPYRLGTETGRQREGLRSGTAQHEINNPSDDTRIRPRENRQHPPGDGFLH